MRKVPPSMYIHMYVDLLSNRVICIWIKLAVSTNGERNLLVPELTYVSYV